MRTSNRKGLIWIAPVLLLAAALTGGIHQIYHPGPRLHVDDADRLYKELALLADDDLKVPFDDRLRSDLVQALDAERPESRALAHQCLEDIYWKDKDFCSLVLGRMEKSSSNEERLRLMALLKRAYPENGVRDPEVIERFHTQWLIAISTEDGWQKSGANLQGYIQSWMSGPEQQTAWMLLNDLASSPILSLRKRGVIGLIHIYWRKDCPSYSAMAEVVLLQMKQGEEAEIREILESNFDPLLALRKAEGRR